MSISIKTEQQGTNNSTIELENSNANTSLTNAIEVIVEVDSIDEDSDEITTLTYNIQDDSTFTDLFDRLLAEGILKSGKEGNEVWALMHKDRFCMWSYYTKTGKYEEHLIWKQLKTICATYNHVRLAYFKSPLDWKDCIINYFHNDGYTICHEGWAEVIGYCNSLCMKTRYRDDICHFYDLGRQAIFKVTIDGKEHIYDMSGHIYESVVYFKPLNSYSKEFNVRGEFSFPRKDDPDEWKKFCYALIDKIAANN